MFSVHHHSFGCLVASPIAFNLYGGIIIVCMGIAFFMMSYVTLIPPLDGLVLNYKKLDLWKEQKHFRVQLEAQRIFEQQLQQEQNLARVNPVHHANATTIHAHHAHLALGVGSPKLQRTFGAGVGGSVNFGGAGHLAAMFSPPMSQPEHDFPHHQLQSRFHGSTTNFIAQASHEYLPSGSTRQNDILTNSKERTERRCRDVNSPQQNFRQNQLGRNVPPIVTSGLNDSPGLGSQGQNYILSPPLVRRQSLTAPPDSPALQYLPVGDDYSQDDNRTTITPGSKTEWIDGDEKWTGSTGGDRILKTAPHPYNDPTTRSGHPTLPLRTSNKPTPPHDPFRKTSISSTRSNSSTATPVQDTPMTVTKGYNSASQGNKAGCQSLYQPPEPVRVQDKHPLQHLPYYYSDPTKSRLTNAAGVARYEERDIALTATARILSSIGGMSGCYGIVGGLPSPGVVSSGVPSPSSSTSTSTPTSTSTSTSKQQPYSSRSQQHEEPSTQQPYLSKSRQKKSALSAQQKQDSPLPRIPEADYRSDSSFVPITLDMSASGPTRSSSETPPTKNRRESNSNSGYSMSTATYMPDIVLTLPTPGDHVHGSRRDEYFGM